MLVWHYEIRGAKNRLVKQGGNYTFKEDALKAGVKFVQEHEHELRESPSETFTVAYGQHLVGGSVCPTLELLERKQIQVREEQRKPGLSDQEREALLEEEKSIIMDIAEHKSSGHQGKPCTGE